jgi:hypothetical protein
VTAPTLDLTAIRARAEATKARFGNWTDAGKSLRDIAALCDALESALAERDEARGEKYTASLRKWAEDKQGAWEHQVLVRADLEHRLESALARVRALEEAFGHLGEPLSVLEYMGKKIKDDALESFNMRHRKDPQRPMAERYGSIGEQIELIAKSLARYVVLSYPTALSVGPGKDG